MAEGLSIIIEAPGSTSDSSSHSKFRPRRWHTKSRNGCFSCKKRRVKCDEKKPSCSQCFEKGLKCQFPPPKISSRASKVATVDTEDSEARDEPDEAHQRILELLNEDDFPSLHAQDSIYTQQDAIELLDQFVTRKEITWMGGSIGQGILQEHGMRLAFDAPYLLHTMLAVSAAYMSHQEPDNEKYSTAASLHHDHSLTLLTAEIRSSLPEKDADAVFGASLMHTLLAFVNSMIAPANQPFGQGHGITWVRSLRGAPILLQTPEIYRALRTGIWAPLNRIYDDIVSTEPIINEAELCPSRTEELAQVRLLKEICLAEQLSPPSSSSSPISPSPPPPPPQRAVLAKQLAALESLVPESAHPLSTGRFICFFAVAPQDMGQLWAADEPRALLILGFWCALISRIQQWWVWPARNECRRIRDHVESLNDGSFDAPLAFLSRYC